MRPAFALITIVAVACDGAGYRVVVHVPGGVGRAMRVEVSVLRSCGEADPLGVQPSDPVRSVDVTSEISDPLGPVAPGRYGLYGRAWDDECVLYAAACVPFAAEAGGEGTIELFLSTLADPAGCDVGYTCRSGSCSRLAIVDAGPDGGPPPDADPCPEGDRCDGACVELATDPENCGGCDILCLHGTTCVAGDCICPAGELDCGPEIGCVDAEHDPLDCGYCGHGCGPREYCDGGECSCRPGLSPCAGGVCVDVESDPRYCGTCDTVCQFEVCDLGDCAGALCGIGRTDCAGACVDLESDPMHCGDCREVCETDQICVGGRCEQFRAAGDCDECPCDGCGDDYDKCCTYPGASSPICLGVTCADD